ncbi:dienelactone hydrolase [Flexivirga endophytica]|uniref:Dienelactone hydrolase n=1 Tax=Flexivirga endophytica TaxID=1849103 RepID=A0A916T1U9_9MICO|nr:dienelactone hydrolase family protein [Flexivirga endophytica]GGB24178.1 dienelactone hydrolase [Flexivirga endophytica]GHB62845.1 dienelactone hydrolase [Flexivirga endophytica]
MATILLLHSAFGLRPAVLRFADALRERGHEVVAPDYYAGNVFDDTCAGLSHRDDVGPAQLLARVRPVIDELPADTVLAGFSLGAAFAQRLAADRPEAAAVILMHSVAAPRHGTWSGQPVQIHRYAEDPFVDPADLQALCDAVRASGAEFEDFVTAGKGHLFTDTDLPDGDAAATASTLDRVDALLHP